LKHFIPKQRVDIRPYPSLLSATLFNIKHDSKMGNSMQDQSAAISLNIKKSATTFFSVLWLLLLAACATVPPPDPNIIKNYKKIGLVRVTSDEQLFVIKRRFDREGEGRGSLAASTGLIGALLEEGTREARRSGFAATHKPINDALKRNMRPELEKLLFATLRERMKSGNALRSEWSVAEQDALGVAYMEYGNKPAPPKFLENARAKCPDCDAVLVVDPGFGLQEGFRARAEADVLLMSLPDGKTWQRLRFINDDKDRKFHHLYYPDAIANAATMADRIPTLIPTLVNQIFPPQ
jgi:hypothetical protein